MSSSFTSIVPGPPAKGPATCGRLRSAPPGVAPPVADWTVSRSVAYGRRVVVAMEFLRAVRRLRGERLSDAARAELDRWDIELSGWRDAVVYKLIPAAIAR